MECQTMVHGKNTRSYRDARKKIRSFDYDNDTVSFIAFNNDINQSNDW